MFSSVPDIHPVIILANSRTLAVPLAILSVQLVLLDCNGLYSRFNTRVKPDAMHQHQTRVQEKVCKQ